MGKRKANALGKIEGREFTEAEGCMPKKKFYRQRAHCNPLSDSVVDVPLRPAAVDWSQHYPGLVKDSGSAAAPQVTIADVGCGFGGMSISLARLFPVKLILGMEIREKVAEYVQRRVEALRKEHAEKGDASAYQNVSVVRANTMKYLCNFFTKGQLEKLFFLFPDPHFKAANHRRRIVNTALLTEYAFFMKPGGVLYTITDVQDLGDWMRDKLDAHPMFDRLSDADLEGDKAAGLLATATEEGQKVRRNGGRTWRWCYRRREAPADAAVVASGVQHGDTDPGGQDG
eukprot:jgi/Ulvmu1/3944/UM018_0167.1